MDAKAISGELTITGGTFIEKVAITCEYSSYTIAISGGQFNAGFDILNYGLINMVFYGDLELVLLGQWFENYHYFSEYSLDGSLRDGSLLSAPISCSSLVDWAEGPCRGVSIRVEP
jgi:hypothetical protein